ncbi:Hypothetical predicted protein [Cloeon dipterum]|uniref:Protein quiver n=1 Tax=Cloeon dipterum TaxID=197152 RepID=A0A8S1EDG3_9INSE|nr:Hypothetical predicted protein [Cloeon dipterum]
MVRTCLLLTLLVNSGFALHCHTCNSQTDRDCTADHQHVRYDASLAKSCEQSFRETLNSVRGMYPGQTSLDVESLVKHQKSSENCVRFSLSKEGANKTVHFFGCSVLGGRETCTSLQRAMGRLHFHGCHLCAGDMCNHAALPLISAYLAAGLALLAAAFA